MGQLVHAMTALLKPAPMSVEDYLELEREPGLRHEFLGGELYAMGGASRRHNTLALNLASALRAHLRGGPCRAFIGDVKVRINFAQDDVFYYPDVVVTCSPADSDPYVVSEPSVVVEVLSPSTERVDRREKFLTYTRLPSLREYILVEQSAPLVSVLDRNLGWKSTDFRAGEAARIPSLDFTLPVDDLYAGTDDLAAG